MFPKYIKGSARLSQFLYKTEFEYPIFICENQFWWWII